MLQFAPGVKVYLACKPVDMRRGFDGLAAHVAQTLRADPYLGAAFVFRNKRGGYVKILTWDGSGLCLFAKRLEKKVASSGPDRRERAPSDGGSACAAD
jgi:transposase